VFFAQGRDDIKVAIEMKYIKELSSHDSNYIQIMNIIARKCLSFMGLTQLGRGFFDPQASVRLYF